ncbi:MAG: ComEC/Rec2 family competence protein [Ginsengibacter sp.]
MMRSFGVPVWKKAPFLRFLPPLISGILIQLQLHFQLPELLIAVVGFVIAYVAGGFLPLSLQFKLNVLQGFVINLLLVTTGAIVIYNQDIRNQANWAGHFYTIQDKLTVTINEEPIEKLQTIKAEGSIENIVHNGKQIKCTGKILIYFAKDSSVLVPSYGQIIVINKNLQAVRNSGNPGSFDYKRYLAYKNIYHQVYLRSADYTLLRAENIDPFRHFIFNARKNILGILKTRLHGHERELSIAEALLIGYTEDLDRNLVQAYSNTGVVHIIAISGLHLGLIYVMISWIFQKIPLIRRSQVARVIFILSCLWMFSFITGGSASVLRSAVMFSCIVIGKGIGKGAIIYNSLAASAFILLCYNPYFLWDAGFQLSYLAVFGIVIFQRPLYHLFYAKNKLIRQLWQLSSVSIAAQIFTFPVCLYYFHQFPNTFLFTNIMMVPLSSLILFAEIILIGLAWMPFIAGLLGTCIYGMVWLMNNIILWFNQLPYAVYSNISITPVSTLLLYVIIILIALWLFYKSKTALILSLSCSSIFFATRAFEYWKSNTARKIIIYNIPQHVAIDFIAGNSFRFIGDTVVSNSLLYNFHLKPARISLYLDKDMESLPGLVQQNKFFKFAGTSLLLIDSQVTYVPLHNKIMVDYIVLSKNSNISVKGLLETFLCKQFILDGSNSLWKIVKWKKDFEQLHLPFYSVPEQGALIIAGSDLSNSPYE